MPNRRTLIGEMFRAPPAGGPLTSIATATGSRNTPISIGEALNP